MGCSPIKAARELGSERRITASPEGNFRMHTGYIGETPPAFVPNAQRAIPREDQHHARRNPRVHRGIPRQRWKQFAARLVDAFATLNYSKHKHLDAQCVQEFLEGKGVLVPVTTEALNAEIASDCPSNTLSGKSKQRSHASSRKRDEDIVCAPSNRGTYTRETVRSLSAVGVGSLMGAVPSTRGPGWTDLRCSGCAARRSAA